MTAFLVEPTFPGFRVARYEDKMGLRISQSAEISLNDCGVPAANRVGEEGQGLKIALEALDGGRVGIAAQAVGLAQGALEAAVKYAKQRRAFGKTISEFQAIQLMLADMQTEIEAARGLMYYAAWLRDQGGSHRGAQPRAQNCTPAKWPIAFARKRCRFTAAWDIRAKATSSDIIATRASSRFTKAPAKSSASSSRASF